jgi:glycosyltransferase involved in cell wall biosynthesis
VRLALICQHFNARGGVSRDAYMFAGALHALGVEIDCYCDPATSTGFSGISLHYVATPHPRLPERAGVPLAHTVFAYRASRAVSRVRSRYDVVYVTGADAWEHDVARVHAVVKAENRRWPSRGGRSFKAARLRARLAPLTRPQNAVERAIQRLQFASDRSRRFVAVTDEVRADLLDLYSLSDEAIDVLPCPIDVRAIRAAPAADARARFGIDRDARLLLFVGNDFYRKGLDEALRVLARLDQDVHLLVAGEGSPRPYRNLARREGVLNRVHFLGHVPAPETFYREADILLLPTREDVWGTTLIEAMAAGIPIVTTAVAGASRVVSEARAGMAVADPTTARLVDATTALLADADSRQAMVNRGQTVAEQYDIAHLAPKLKCILERVASSAQRR